MKDMLINLIPTFLELRIQLAVGTNSEQICIKTACENKPKVLDLIENRIAEWPEQNHDLIVMKVPPLEQGTAYWGVILLKYPFDSLI